MGLKAISTYLNQRGITRRNSKWSISGLSLILKNTCYYGDLIFRKSSYADSSYPKIPVKTPSIITKNVFEEVRKGLKSRRLKNADIKGERSPSLLTGILKC